MTAYLEHYDIVMLYCIQEVLSAENCCTHRLRLLDDPLVSESSPLSVVSMVTAEACIWCDCFLRASAICG